MITAILIALGLFALFILALACHQYFFRDSFFNDDEDQS